MGYCLIMSIRINGDNTTAAPGIAKGDDTDTGIQLGTDEVNLVTGGTARATVDSSGNLGIGLTSPSSKAHIKGGSLTVEHGSPNTGTGQFNINVENNSQTSFSYDDQGSIVFGTTATPHNQGTFSEKLRVDSSGRLMLNRPSATHQLSLTGTANDKSAELQLTASSVASGYIGPNADGLNIGTDTAGIVFKTGVTGGGSVGATGTTRFSIGSAGKFTTNGVQQYFDRGAAQGTSAFSRDFTLGGTQSCLVIAAFNHYGLFGYGCSRLTFAATGSSFSTETIHNQSTGNGGSWSITKPNNSTIRVTKNGGTYSGSGHWIIHVISS